MKSLRSSRLHRFLVLSMLLGAVLAPRAFAGFPTRCVQEPGPILDSIGYSLYVTVPTTGYHFTLQGTRVSHGVVRLAVRWKLDPGAHGDVVLTHRLRFALIAPKLADRYAVAFNGGKAGPIKPTVMRQQ